MSVLAVLEPYNQGTRALTLEPTPALLEVDEALDEIEQYAIQIRRRDLPDTADVFGSQVVAVIELVSPANKGLTGTADRRKFLARRSDYLASPVSYTEIDLLTEGERDLPQIVERLGDYRGMVWSSQVQKRSRHHWAWGWELTDTIPSIILPLEYPHIHTLDLSWCYAHAYRGQRSAQLNQNYPVGSYPVFPVQSSNLSRGALFGGPGYVIRLRPSLFS